MVIRWLGGGYSICNQYKTANSVKFVPSKIFKEFDMEQPLTFERIPQAIADLTAEVGQLKEMLGRILEKDAQPTSTDEMIGIDEACIILNMKKSTVYANVQQGRIPYYRPSKKLLFKRAELIDWLETGRRKTTVETKEDLIANMQKGQRRKPANNWGGCL